MNTLSQQKNLDSTMEDLKVFIDSRHPLVVIENSDEDRIHRLLLSVSQKLNMELEEWTSAYGIKNNTATSKIIETQSVTGLISYMMRRDGDLIYLLKDFHSYLKDPILIRNFRELIHKFRKKHSTVFLTGLNIELPGEIKSSALFYELKPPSQKDLKDLIKNVYYSLSIKNNIKYKMDKKGEEALLFALKGMSIEQARQSLAFAFLEDKVLNTEDIPKILKKKANLINDGGILEFFPALENDFELGGFKKLKSWFQKAYIGFSTEARKFNLPFPKGVLIMGIPGCGKSLSAKVVSKIWGFPLLKLDTGKLFDKYIGESEKKMRKCIKIAESLSPCILWIDEVEKSFPTASGAGTDGGLSQRIFGTFLTWMQEKKEPVFVIATANQVHKMPPELLRKGRFDEIFFVDLPSLENRKEIFKIHLIRRNLNPDNYNIEQLGEESHGMSGSEIEQIILSSLYSCLHEKKSHGTDSLIDEMKKTIPLSQSRKESIDSLRDQYKSRFSSAN